MFNMIDKFKFGLWLQQQRESKGWSQAELSRHSGLHRAVISKIESGTKPMPETLTALAETFGMSTIAIFRKAGILPDDPSELSPKKLELLHAAEQADDETIELILDVLRSASERRRRQVPSNGQMKKA